MFIIVVNVTRNGSTTSEVISSSFQIDAISSGIEFFHNEEAVIIGASKVLKDPKNADIDIKIYKLNDAIHDLVPIMDFEHGQYCGPIDFLVRQPELDAKVAELVKVERDKF